MGGAPKRGGTKKGGNQKGGEPKVGHPGGSVSTKTAPFCPILETDGRNPKLGDANSTQRTKSRAAPFSMDSHPFAPKFHPISPTFWTPTALNPSDAAPNDPQLPKSATFSPILGHPPFKGFLPGCGFSPDLNPNFNHFDPNFTQFLPLFGPQRPQTHQTPPPKTPNYPNLPFLAPFWAAPPT